MNDCIEQAEPKAPKVTVLMAVYNGARYLRDAIESILRQSFADFEFVIVNDGSTDSSRDIVLSYRDPRIRLIDNQENIGLTKSLNKGLSLASGEYVARQDADDISYPTRIEKQIEYFETYPHTVLLGTQALNIDELGRRDFNDVIMRKATSKLAIKWQLLFDSAFIHTSVMFKRSIVWNILGGYDVYFSRNQDMELWWRIAKKYEVANLPEMLLESRYTKHSVSRNYSMNDVRKVRDVLLIRLEEELRVDPRIAYEWLEFWHQVTNPSLRTNPVFYGSSLCNFNKIVNAFQSRYPEVCSDEEYHRSLTSVYARVLLYLAICKKITALQWYSNIIFVNTFFSIRFIPKFCLLFLFGEHARTIFRKINKKY
jgi:glycosyltransferase involved in cell wall biosynthesis